MGATSDKSVQTRVLPACALLALVYFIQGVGEPTEGLIAQPVRRLLKSWGEDAGRIAGFGAIASLPWMLKPLFGLISDRLPLLGSRRRSYLLLSGAALGASMFLLAGGPAEPSQRDWLLGLLTIASAAVAMGDVAADGYMVEVGQPIGKTGLFQTVQWSALYAGSIATGWLGGLLSEGRAETTAFALVGALGLLTVALCLFGVREPSAAAPPTSEMDRADARRLGGLVWLAFFIVVWNFDLASNALWYLHLTGPIGLSEQQFGACASLSAVGSFVGCATYGLYCNRLSVRALAWCAVGAGAASAVWLSPSWDWTSAATGAVLSGAAYGAGMVIQFDLAARLCPTAWAGFAFACLMGLANFSTIGAGWIGGSLYDRLGPFWGPESSYQAIVWIEGAATLACGVAASRLDVSIRPPEPATGQATSAADILGRRGG
jgi:MFS family permease